MKNPSLFAPSFEDLTMIISEPQHINVDIADISSIHFSKDGKPNECYANEKEITRENFFVGFNSLVEDFGFDISFAEGLIVIMELKEIEDWGIFSELEKAVKRKFKKARWTFLTKESHLFDPEKIKLTVVVYL